MNKLTRISFNIFKFTSLGFILLYLLIVVLVGFAGHSSGDSSSFFGVAFFSLLLFLLINYYQKRVVNGKQIKMFVKILFVIVILVTTIISVVAIFSLLDVTMGMEVVIVCLILGLYTFSGVLILKFIFLGK